MKILVQKQKHVIGHVENGNFIFRILINFKELLVLAKQRYKGNIHMSNKKFGLIMENWKKFVNEQTPAPQSPNPTAPTQPAPQNQQQQPGKVDLKQAEAQLMKALQTGPAETRQFLNSPVGKSPEVRNLLAQGLKVDGNQADDKVRVSGPSDIPVNPAKMIPTQNFIDLMQSVSFPLGSAKGLITAISNKKGFGTIVVDGPLIIDGHHRWSGTVAITPNGTINALNVNWPGQNTKQKLAAAQASIAGFMGPGKDIPSAGGDVATNILGKKAPEIAKMIMNNVNKQTDKGAPGPLLNDVMMKEIIGDVILQVVFSIMI